MRVHVNTLDLRKALAAVVPHSDDDGFVRCTVTDQMVYVQASNGVTAAMAIVSVWEHQDLVGDPNEDSFDLPARTVKELLKVFRPKSKPENDLDDQLQIMVDDADVHVLDVSGLFPGKSYSVPRDKESHLFPNLPRIFDTAFSKRPRVPERVLVSGHYVKDFAAAGAAYGEALTIEPTADSKLIVISCGESFLGALTQTVVEDGSDKAASLTDWRDGWKRRLPAVAGALIEGRQQADNAA